MRVTIDGRDYVPETNLFRLTDDHFEAEMQAWSRAIHGDGAEKKKVEPLPVPGRKKVGLFE